MCTCTGMCVPVVGVHTYLYCSLKSKQAQQQTTGHCSTYTLRSILIIQSVLFKTTEIPTGLKDVYVPTFTHIPTFTHVLTGKILLFMSEYQRANAFMFTNMRTDQQSSQTGCIYVRYRIHNDVMLGHQ